MNATNARKLKILLLEDTDDDAKLVERALHAGGLDHVLRRVEGREGYVQALRQEVPDVIVSDYRLPDLDGKEAIKLAAELAPLVPVIIVTGAMQDEVAVELLRAGAADYILKDRLSRLAPAINAALVAAQQARLRQQAEMDLRTSEEKFRTLFVSSRDAMFTLAGPAWTFTASNPAARKMFGFAKEAEIFSFHPWDLSPELQPDGRSSEEVGRQMIGRALGNGGHYFEMIARRRNKECFATSVLLTRVKINGEAILQATIRDISAATQARAALIESQTRFQQLAEHIPQVFFLIDAANTQTLYVSPAYETIWGKSCESLYAAPASWLDAVHPEDRERVAKLNAGLPKTGRWGFDHEYRVVRPDGETRWIRDCGYPIFNADGEYIRLAMIATDVTEQRELNTQLVHALSHDAITGLRHHAALQSELAARLEDGSRPLWIFVIGLDRFQVINESMGHVMGDDLLRRTARRLADALGAAGELARFDADQFVVAATALDRAAALALAECLREAIAVPIDDGGGHGVVLSASVGISHSPDHGRTVPDLLRRAQTAMIQAKHQGRDCTREFAAEQMVEIEDRLQLGSELRGAVGRGELELHYQPRVAVGKRSICGFDALLRWNSPTLGPVSPVRFIPVAEALGLIPEISEWALVEACRQARVWIDRGHRDFNIAVNVAAAQLHRPGLVAGVRAALEQHALSPEVLSIELTESALMENVAKVTNTLKELKAIGISLALGGFGTGSSSLAYLRQFPIDNLKIDKRFVRGLPDEGNDVAIAKAIVAMSHQLHMPVTAEDVETPAQLDFLEGIGCDELQGYLIGRPVPAHEAEGFLPDPA